MKNDPTTFPDVPLEPAGEGSQWFLDHELTDLRTVIRYVRDLPYNRTEDRADLLSVLREGAGTCSTKHALLAQICDNQGFDEIQLTLGIYEMTEANTPGVGMVLAKYGLDYIPEAHCYLTYENDRYDFTRNTTSAEPIDRFLVEESISPAQIGDYKLERHRDFLADWIGSTDLQMGLDELWQVREDCIDRLSRLEFS